MARRRFRLALTASLLPLAAPASGQIYLHSPSLEKATASAADALPTEVEALKPFDDQLANLKTSAGQEDLAVARYWTGVRDAHFARLIAMTPADRSKRLSAQIDRRIGVLAGGLELSSATDPSAAIAEKATLQELADSRRRQYLLAPKADPRRDLSCKAIQASLGSNETITAEKSADPAGAKLGEIENICAAIDTQDATINQFADAGGLIGATIRDAAAMVAKGDAELTPRAADLQKQIDTAKNFSEKEASVEQLRTFEDGLKSLLDYADPATKLMGWSKAADGIDAMIEAQVCGSDKVDQATKDKAKCGDAKPQTTTGRIEATWAVAKALAQISDANDSRRRSLNWLLAAKAIIAAEKADAALKVEEAKAAAEAAIARLRYLQLELVFLNQARFFARGPGGPCPAAPRCDDSGAGSNRSFAAYVDSWNEGRLPAQVLEYRPIQINREYGVRRARAIAQKQHALASAGTVTLKDYASGGLTAAMIAQALFDAAILGVGIGGL